MTYIRNRYAIFVGIDKYLCDEIPPLKYAVNDATELSDLLKQQGSVRISTGNQRLLTNQDATRTAIIETINEISSIARKDDLVLFYYAGHGFSQKPELGEGHDDKTLSKYIIPYDTKIDEIDSSAIDFEFLSNRLNRIKSNQFIMFFDCCHSGALGGRTFNIEGERSLPSQGYDIDTRYLDTIAGSGKVVITACTGKQVALEKAEFAHGLFTHNIIEGLEGKADYKHDRMIDLDELWMFISEKMNKGNSEQTPVMAGRIEGGPIFLGQGIRFVANDENKKRIETDLVKKYPNLQEIVFSENDDNRSIAIEAAKYLDNIITHNTKIAVSCGRTLIETINNLERKNLSNIEIFPLNGSPTDEVHLTDSMILSYLLWSKFDAGEARAHVVPTGIPEKLFAQIEEGVDEVAQNILLQANGCHIFLFGIGSPRDNKNIEYLLEKSGLTYEDLDSLGVEGEMNFHLYDKDGNLLALSDKINEEQKEKISRYNSKFFSIKAEDINTLKDRPGIKLIIVAGGEKKRKSIKAALKGRLVTTLITDLQTGAWLAGI